MLSGSLQPRSGLAGLYSARRKWPQDAARLLRPLLRAYVLGYASTVAPRLLTLVLRYLARRRSKDGQGWRGEPFLVSLQSVLRSGLQWQRFPTFCAVLVGGTTLLDASQLVVLGSVLQALGWLDASLA